MAESCPSSLISLNTVRTNNRCNTFKSPRINFNTSPTPVFLIYLNHYYSFFNRIENSTDFERCASASSIARRRRYGRHDLLCVTGLYHHRVNYRFSWRDRFCGRCCWSHPTTGRRVFHIRRDSRSRRNGLGETFCNMEDDVGRERRRKVPLIRRNDEKERRKEAVRWGIRAKYYQIDFYSNKKAIKPIAIYCCARL